MKIHHFGITAVIGVLLGFIAGYQSRGNRPVLRDESVAAGAGRSASGYSSETAKQPAVSAEKSAVPEAKETTLRDALSSPVRSERVAGMLSLLKSAPDAALEGIMNQLNGELEQGRLSGAEFVMAVELMGERGSPATAAALFENKTALAKFPDAFTGFFAAWARRDSGAAWAFCTARFKDDGPSYPEPVLKGIVRGCGLDAPELKALLQVTKVGADWVAGWRVEPVIRTSGFSGAAQTVRAQITGEASEQTAFNEMAAIGLVALESGGDAVAQAVQDISAGGKLGPHTFPDPSGSLIHEYAKRSPAEAIEWAKTLPPGSQRGIALNAAIFQQGLKDPDVALEWVRSIPEVAGEERMNVLLALRNAFRQTPKLTSAERTDLIEQTDVQIDELKAQGK